MKLQFEKPFKSWILKLSNALFYNIILQLVSDLCQKVSITKKVEALCEKYCELELHKWVFVMQTRDMIHQLEPKCDYCVVTTFPDISTSEPWFVISIAHPICDHHGHLPYSSICNHESDVLQLTNKIFFVFSTYAEFQSKFDKQFNKA